MRQKIQNKYIYQIVVVEVVMLAVLGILFPGWLLVWQSKEQMNMVDAVPVEYYSPANLAVARNASANLGVYQKLQLITGRWESNAGEVNANEREMENYEAVELAKEQMDALYQAGVYPTSLLSNYENWYSWEAEFCKVVDATFNTYAAYYWKLIFTKYDGSEKHEVYMLDDGTIFLAEAWSENGIDSSKLAKLSEKDVYAEAGLTGIVTRNMSAENLNLEGYFAFTDIETAELLSLSLAELRVGEKEYYGMQLHSANRYLYSLQPLN